MPAWHDSLSKPAQSAAYARVLLSLAAVYASEDGTATALAKVLGVQPSAVLQARKRGVISADMALKLESALGRELFPRELFRPDLFLIGG